jgi:hypothetical protein
MGVMSQSVATQRRADPAALVRWSNAAGLSSIIAGVVSLAESHRSPPSGQS